MPYEHHIDTAFSDIIGNDGADRNAFDLALSQADKAVEKLREHKKNNTLPTLNVSAHMDDLAEIEETALHIRDHFSALVVFGMGASSRGGSTLAALMDNKFAHPKTRIHFMENIDPLTFGQLLTSLEFKSTMFLVISKSGGTVETMAQTFVLMNEVESRLGKAGIKNHFIFITEPGKNPLRQIAEVNGIKTFDHDPNIGGRYSGLTVVGLLPAAVAGLDIRAVRQGAEDVITQSFKKKSSEPAIGAALNQAMFEKGKTISVVMPYCDRLMMLTAWHQQLWEESLGKGGKGTTLLRALGATDQHSRMQLFLDGPRDKFLTFILLKQAGTGAIIHAQPDNALSYLSGHQIGDLMESAQNATVKTLTKNKCPLRTIYLPQLDETSLGALMMHFMLETMIMAELWNINAFDQPAVEESKQLARKLLSNK